MNSLKERLVGIVGKENVLDDAATLEQYSKDRSFAKPIMPLCVIKVKNAGEVEKIVKLANEMKTTLVPVSSGGSHYRGDTVPSVPGSVVVDLSGMKRILNVNRQQRMVVVEPGVTYGELQKALDKEGMTISTSLAPRATKSVIASVLDLEPRLNSLHQWSFTDPLRCTEVIWGDGNRMYTGEAGMGPLDLDKQWNTERWQISPTGPMMLDFYRLLTGSQGSMGIVTWASLKCELKTSVHKLYLVGSKKVEDLNEFMYQVIRVRFSSQCMVMSGSYLASLLGESPSQVKELIGELPPWVAIVGIEGQSLLPEERVNAQEQDIAEIAQKCGLKLVPAIPGAKSDKVLKKILGPSGEKYWKDTYKGGFQEIFFTTTLDNTPRFIAKMCKLAEEAGYPVSDIGTYLQPQNMGTCYHCEFILPYNPDDRKEVERMKKLFVKASEEFSTMGAYYLRPHGIWARLQLNKDAQSTILLKRMKDIFDPNNIMNTGKLSI